MLGLPSSVGSPAVKEPVARSEASVNPERSEKSSTSVDSVPTVTGMVVVASPTVSPIEPVGESPSAVTTKPPVPSSSVESPSEVSISMSRGSMSARRPSESKPWTRTFSLAPVFSRLIARVLGCRPIASPRTRRSCRAV